MTSDSTILVLTIAVHNSKCKGELAMGCIRASTPRFVKKPCPHSSALPSIVKVIGSPNLQSGSYLPAPENYSHCPQTHHRPVFVADMTLPPNPDVQMACKIEIPFRKELESLPAPLPCEDQIRDCSDIIHGNEPSTDQKVVVIGPYAIKYGKYLSQLEGENLLFLERCAPHIPAPKLYAMWRGEGAKSDLFIIMDLVPGISLSKLWPTLGDLDKTQILNELRDVFESLHSLPSSGFFGDIHGGPIPYHLFWDADGDPTITGPFKHGREMILGLAKRSRANSALNGKHPYLAEFFERHLALELDDHSPTFCHSDVQPKNIIVDIAQEDTTQGKVFRVSIIDWEVAGWYPSYWEYAAAFLSFRWDENDWPNRSEDFLPVHAAKAAMFRLIHQNLWF